MPILYVLVLKNVQSHLNHSYLIDIQNVMILDPGPLLDGRETLEKRLNTNIRNFIKADWFLQAARLNLTISVTTPDGRILYPSYEKQEEEGVSPKVVAQRNFELLNQGVRPMVMVSLPHGSRFANLVLGVALLGSLGIFSYSYLRGVRMARAESRIHDSIIQEFKDEDRMVRKQLDELEKEKYQLSSQMIDLKGKDLKDQDRAKINETEMFDEIVNLEEKLEEIRGKELEKETEIQALKSKLDKYEKQRQVKTKKGTQDLPGRRLAALYKQVDFHRRAIAGFSSLPEDMQIKAEEVILQLDRNPDKVIIKRKVFSGKKHRGNVLEVIFGYNGRLYFRTQENKRIEVLVIGTKNSQGKDMDFLHKL